MTGRTAALGGLCAAFLFAAGCRDNLVDLPDVDDPLVPPLAGLWAGEYVGVLGSAEPDTFGVAVQIERVVADFPFEGSVVQNGRTIHSCGLGVVDVESDGRVAFDCVERSQLDSLLVLRVEARLDASAEALTGVVRAGLSPGAAAYPITLHRTAR